MLRVFFDDIDYQHTPPQDYGKIAFWLCVIIWRGWVCRCAEFLSRIHIVYTDQFKVIIVSINRNIICMTDGGISASRRVTFIYIRATDKIL